MVHLFGCIGIKYFWCFIWYEEFGKTNYSPHYFFKRLYLVSFFCLDRVFESHKKPILTALSPIREYFTVQRLLSHGDKLPYKSMERFLSSIGFHHLTAGE